MDRRRGGGEALVEKTNPVRQKLCGLLAASP